MSEWIKWSGGEAPVTNETPVQVMFRCEESPSPHCVAGPAGELRWNHLGKSSDIVGYRVVTPKVDPLSDEHEALTFGPLDKDTKSTNPKDAAASYRLPIHMVPDTLILYAAMAFAEGDSKYVAYNFRIAGVRASVYISALRRHLMRYVNGEWADKKTKVPHLASVAACVAILIDGHVTKTIVDDRPPAVDLGDEIERAEEVIAHVYDLNKDKRPVGVSYTIADTGAVV